MLWIYHRGDQYNPPKFPYKSLAVQTGLSVEDCAHLEHIADIAYDSRIRIIAEMEDNTVNGPNRFVSLFYVHEDDLNVFVSHMREYGIHWYSDMDPNEFPKSFAVMYKDLNMRRV